jgi:hypothetical protein
VGAAEPLLRECLEICETALPEDDWRTAEAAVLLGRALVMQGHFEEGRAASHRRYEKLASALGAATRRPARPWTRSSCSTRSLAMREKAAHYRALKR